MILIDETTVPESERPDLAKVNAELESVAAGLLFQIDIREPPYSLSKLAWKIALFSNSIAHRFVALAEGTAISWNASNPLSAVLNARASMETFASYYEFGTQLAKLVPLDDFEAIDNLITKCLFGTRDEEMLKEFPDLKARQILNSIDMVDKTAISGFRDHYDTLSEFCHPNSFGHRGLFSSTDRQTGITTFEVKWDFTVPLKAALGMAALFKRSMDTVDADLRKLADAHHAAHPSPLSSTGL
jgi:hypothetical protein